MKKIKKRGVNNKPGKPSTYTKRLSLEIRKLYLSGLKKIQIQEKLKIPASTWDWWYWRNIQGFRTDFENWEREKQLFDARLVIGDILQMPTEIQEIGEDEDGKRAIVVTEAKFVKIKADMAIYVTETLGKEYYSKRIIQEDPNAASKSEVEEIRQSYKSLISRLKPKKGIDKLKNALK